MATPTPGRQSQGQVAATPPVSLSNNRHVPSPQQFKKSPANLNTLYGGHNFPLGYDSPSAVMALGIDDGRNDFTLPTHNVPVEKDEKKKRLEAVVGILKANKGHMSEQGLERLSKRFGLECMLDPDSGGSTRTLIVAGKGFAIDITFVNKLLSKVAVDFPDTSDAVAKHNSKAQDILFRDLDYGPGESPLTKMLDKFAINLERLAQLDHLTVVPGFNCHQAIAGIHESLLQLHQWEVARLKERPEMENKSNDYVERIATCTKSGRPLMHARDRVGMCLDYWQERRLVQKIDESKKKSKIWSLLIECTPTPTSFTQVVPARVSENWISSSFKIDNPVLEEGVDGDLLDWLEPEPTLLPSVETVTLFPEVMFVAKFDPPLHVNWATYHALYSNTGHTVEPYKPLNAETMIMLDDLWFPSNTKATDLKTKPTPTARQLYQRTAVPVQTTEGTMITKYHKNTLIIEKRDFGCTMNEYPFAHPKQLVQMLPILRQFALLESILRNSFSDPTKTPLGGTSQAELNRKEHFASFMKQDVSGVPKTTVEKDTKVEVTVTTEPDSTPILKVVFILNKREAFVSFIIGLNGAILVGDENILEEAGEGKKTWTVEDLARILEITQDLGIWLEFVKRRLG